jgi:hypothetical protein
MGCYNSSPLKQNLVSRFLSIVVRGVEIILELDFITFFELNEDTLSCVKDLLLLKV